MIKRLNPFILTEEQKENHSLAEWAFDSHNWIEYDPGYYKCDWCQQLHTSVMGISIDFPLCKKNPILVKVMGGEMK